MLQFHRSFRAARAENVVCGISLLGVLLLTLAGCGGSVEAKPEALVPAEGVVKLDGRPMEGIRLTFHPTAENKAVGGCWAITDNQGRFKVMHLSNKEGIPAGAYHVTFSRFLKPDGSFLGPGESPTMTSSSESIAPNWSDVSMAHLHNKIDIPEKGSIGLDFNVSTAPKR